MSAALPSRTLWRHARLATLHGAEPWGWIERGALVTQGEHIAWVGTVVHEGENGAIDPGGFAPRATDPYGEGLRIPPMKIGEGYTLRRDVVNMFQNHVRDPLLWLIDIDL